MGLIRLVAEFLDDHHCASPHGVMPARPRQFALIYEWQRGPSQQYSPAPWQLYMPVI
jgi:hypothetical protein